MELPGLASCGMFTHYDKEDGATLTRKDAMRCVDYRQRKAHAEMSREVAEMLKAYRLCAANMKGTVLRPRTIARCIGTCCRVFR